MDCQHSKGGKISNINPTWVDGALLYKYRKGNKMHGLCCIKAVWVRKVREAEEEEAGEREEERPSYCKRPTLFSRACGVAAAAAPADRVS